MTISALIFPVKDTSKKIGNNGLVFRACTSMKKSGKQSKEYAENFEGMFFDCITFDNNVINTIKKAAKDKKGIDIDAYAEVNIWTSKNNVEHKDIVFRITGAKVHEKKSTADNGEWVEITTDKNPF